MTPIEKINQFTRRELSEEEVYLFDIILCDNDIDRDLECFSENALAQMQKLFIGKTGIFDHNLQSAGQTARIYDTELVRSPDQKTKDGRTLLSLKAHAYMIRTDSNLDFIKEIDAGIKKEVSVSCSAGKRLCSVCGTDKAQSCCNHIAGKKYGQKSCYTILEDIQDAYEWSFVAVPAQPAAGVTKYFKNASSSAPDTELSELLSDLEQQTRSEVLALCRNQSQEPVSKALCIAAEKMDLRELVQFKKSLIEQEHSLSQAAVQLADFRQK
ncbi:MAG: hypothetical protein IJ642_01405 [Oscillospiraceae bacterium]|nr:hypothetical protein [Oscillospiraceae bacterium]